MKGAIFSSKTLITLIALPLLAGCLATAPELDEQERYIRALSDAGCHFTSWSHSKREYPDRTDQNTKAECE